MEEAGVLGILTSFYETVDKGLRDGFLWSDDRFWIDTEDAVAELVAGMLHDDRPLFRQIAMVEKSRPRAASARPSRRIELERDDGVRKTDRGAHARRGGGLFNEELRARGRQRRIVALDTSDGWKMYVALELRLARKLAAEGALPIASLDSLSD